MCWFDIEYQITLHELENTIYRFIGHNYMTLIIKVHLFIGIYEKAIKLLLLIYKFQQFYVQQFLCS